MVEPETHDSAHRRGGVTRPGGAPATHPMKGPGYGRTALLVYPNSMPEDITELATAWDLHPLLKELLPAGQRSKL